MSKYSDCPTLAQHDVFLTGVESVLGAPTKRLTRRDWNDYAADWGPPRRFTVQLSYYYGSPSDGILRYGTGRIADAVRMVLDATEPASTLAMRLTRIHRELLDLVERTQAVTDTLNPQEEAAE